MSIELEEAIFQNKISQQCFLPSVPKTCYDVPSVFQYTGGDTVLKKKFLQVIFLCLCISCGIVRNQAKSESLLLTIDTLVGKLCKAIEMKCNLAP